MLFNMNADFFRAYGGEDALSHAIYVMRLRGTQ